MRQKIISFYQLATIENNFISVAKNANFLKLAASQACSIFCAQLLNFTLAIKVFNLTHTSFSVSLLFLFYLIPAYALGLFSGVFVDYWSRRKVLIYTNILQAITALFYLFAGGNVWLIYATIFVYSAIDEFYYPAESALLPNLVTAKQLPAANSFFNLSTYGALFFGYTLGGPIIKIFGENAPYYIACGLLAIAVIASFLLQKDAAPRSRHQLSVSFFPKIKDDIREYYSYIRHEPKVYLPLAVLVTFQAIAASVGVILPAIGTDVFKMNLLDLSVILIMPLSIGGFLGALFVDWRMKKSASRKGLIAIGATIAGCSFLGLSLMGAFSFIFIPFVVVAAFFIGFSAIIFIVTANTAIQKATPNELRGRVFGAVKLVQSLLIAIPVVGIAKIADLFGVLPMMFFISFVILLLGAISFTHYRKSMS